MKKRKTQEGKGLRILGVVLLCIGVLGAIMALVDGKISTAVVSVVVFVGGGLIALTKSNRPKKESEILEVKFNAPDNTAKMNENPATTIKFTVSSSNGPIKHEGEPIKLTMIDLKGYKSPSGGYGNLAEYDIDGYVINEKTGRKNIKHYSLYAKDETEAVEKFKKKYGEPVGDLNIELVLAEPATDRDFNEMKDIGVDVPNDISWNDAATIHNRMLSRSDDDDPIPPIPSDSFVQFAEEIGCFFSRFSSAESLLEDVIENLGIRDRIAFYAFNVDKADDGIDVTLSNTRIDIADYYDFADYAMNDDKFMRSFEKRHPEEFVNPNRRTDAYQIFKDFNR